MIPINEGKYKTMLSKLDGMYERKEEIIKLMKVLKVEYEQLEDDIELLQNMIMHQSNMDSRKKKFE